MPLKRRGILWQGQVVGQTRNDCLRRDISSWNYADFDMILNNVLSLFVTRFLFIS